MQNHELLDILRIQIDTLDGEIVDLLARRFQIVEQIGDIKASSNMPIKQNDRFNTLLDHLKNEAINKDVDPNFIENIWNLIHNESIKRQENNNKK